MNIRLTRNSNRRIAWTDKCSGYLEFLFSENSENDGYFRGSTRLLTGFSSDGHSLKEAEYIDVRPEGFMAAFVDGMLNVSLLLDEQAFYIYSAKSAGIPGSAGKVQQLEAEITEDNEQSQKSGIDTEESVEAKEIEWTSEIIDGCTVVSSSAGFAAAAEFNFRYVIKENDVELYRETQAVKNPGREKPFSADGWYIVFENNQTDAVKKAVRLAKGKAIGTHCRTIAAFLEKCAIDSGDKRFDEAFLWARFNGCMLATKDSASGCTGIWAGLPWFRDNWGRDTFISLCGTLLASGCIAEAKDVLLGFAGFQDVDEASSTYGRIPNRYRSADDVIYNTADGTLWFIRALWEYVQYSRQFFQNCKRRFLPHSMLTLRARTQTDF